MTAGSQTGPVFNIEVSTPGGRSLVADSSGNGQEAALRKEAFQLQWSEAVSNEASQGKLPARFTNQTPTSHRADGTLAVSEPAVRAEADEYAKLLLREWTSSDGSEIYPMCGSKDLHSTSRTRTNSARMPSGTRGTELSFPAHPSIMARKQDSSRSLALKSSTHLSGLNPEMQLKVRSSSHTRVVRERRLNADDQISSRQEQSGVGFKSSAITQDGQPGVLIADFGLQMANNGPSLKLPESAALAWSRGVNLVPQEQSKSNLFAGAPLTNISTGSGDSPFSASRNAGASEVLAVTNNSLGALSRVQAGDTSPDAAPLASKVEGLPLSSGFSPAAQGSSGQRDSFDANWIRDYGKGDSEAFAKGTVGGGNDPRQFKPSRTADQRLINHISGPGPSAARKDQSVGSRGSDKADKPGSPASTISDLFSGVKTKTPVSDIATATPHSTDMINVTQIGPTQQRGGPGQSISPFEAIDMIGSARRPNEPTLALWLSRPAQGLQIGYHDLSLGYVELNAHATGSGIHAALVTQSMAAVEVLSSHLGSLSGWLAERRTPVETITVQAIPEGLEGGISFGSGHDRHQRQASDQTGGEQTSADQNIQLMSDVAIGHASPRSFAVHTSPTRLFDGGSISVMA